MRASVPLTQSARRVRRTAAGLLAALLLTQSVLPAAAQIPAAEPPAPSSLPALGESAGRDLSPAAERALGDRIMRSIRPDPAVIDDPVLAEHIDDLWQRLVSAARRRGDITTEVDSQFAWETFLVREPSVNAFALPGGYVGVHLGLINVTTTRDELASVLAHELSHVTQRHIVRSIGVQQTQSLVSLAAMILGVLAASYSPAAAQALMTGGQAVAVQNQLNFSRDMEREADRIGFGVLTGAGFSPAGMASMFERLEEAARLNDDGSYPYLRSHPLTTERIGEARGRLGSQQRRMPTESDDPVHTLLRMRARVLMDPRAVVLRPIIDGGTQPEAARTGLDSLNRAYGALIAATQLRDERAGEAAMEQMHVRAQALPATTRDRLMRELDLAELEFLLMRRDGQRADALLARHASDDGRPLLVLRAQRALLPDATAAQRTRAAADLQTAVATRPRDALAWSLLAQTWERLGQPLRAVRADAESSAALGRMADAIERLRSAQRQAKSGNASTPADFVELSVIDSRLRTFEAERRREMELDRNGP